MQGVQPIVRFGGARGSEGEPGGARGKVVTGD
jgi:hypothetical protein